MGGNKKKMNKRNKKIEDIVNKANEFSEGWESLKMISLGENYDTQ